MTSNARQNKAPRKGAPASTRQPAWSGARASPTFSPTSSSPRPSSVNANPPPAGHDKILNALTGLTGTTVTLTTRTGQRYEGVVQSTSATGDTNGVTLRDAKEISIPGAPLKDQVFIASTNIEDWSSGPADAGKIVANGNGDTFHTDTDISRSKLGGTERELQAWQAPTDLPPANSTSSSTFATGDDLTFGPGSTSNVSWDQFAANEKLFGVKATFDEDLYTTKLDRNGQDYKERERKAMKIASEILGVSTSNPHVAEERQQNLAVDDSGVNEEDRYGAVVRGANAYVPPGARKAAAPGNASAAAPTPVKSNSQTDVPKVAVNGPDGASAPAKGGSPAPANKPPADPVPAFRDFVTNEKQRLTQKRQALVKNDMDKKMADLVKFSQSFKLNKPIPEDLVSILAKDEEKQKAIREKSTKDATSAQARSIGNVVPTTGVPPRAPAANAKEALLIQAKAVDGRKPSVPASGSSGAVASKISAGAAPMSTTTKPAAKTETAAAKSSKPAMFIQAIPPFKGPKSKPAASAAPGTSSGAVNGSTSAGASPAVKSASPAAPGGANANVNARLNVNASSFRPNPRASAFTPGATSPNPSTSGQSIASASASPKGKEQLPATPNPFFGTRPIKKGPPVNVKDDFNPFKTNKVSDPSSVPAIWPYTGKRYMLMFPAPQHPPQGVGAGMQVTPGMQGMGGMVPVPVGGQHPGLTSSPHQMPPSMGAPGQNQQHHMPGMGGPGGQGGMGQAGMGGATAPPSYDEDAAAQAAARGYMYYPPYGYPGQPMMPGMPPPGAVPPGFMPSPYMQPMGYPPGMPPNAMYAPPPNMGQMPYMPPPPPGTYPPPPNGAGPRPSMPPTPIPAQAHPYYHQSPQLQHAVPYPMMMPPPPNAVPHPNPYEGAPAPVQMGGHA